MPEFKSHAVITGYGVISSCGDNAHELYHSMQSQRSGIASLNCFDVTGLSSDIAGIVRSIREKHQDERDALPDFSTLFAIKAIEEALESANISRETLAQKRVALCVGNANTGMEKLEDGIIENKLAALIEYPAHKQSDNIAKHFGILGPVLTFTSACTSSSSAMGFAKQLIDKGVVDLVIAGGTDALAKTIYAGFHSLQSVAPQVCSPYDVKMGLSLGEGAGFVILEPQTQASERGQKAIVQLAATASSLDAYHATAPEPCGAGVRRSFATAMAKSDVTVEDIDYINTHGTGTPANDGAELKGIFAALQPRAKNSLPVSSSKSYFGHTLGAAGAIEFISALVAIEQGEIPSTLNGDDIREDCQGHDIVVNGLRKHKVDCFAATNSAFGGHNTTLLARKLVSDIPVAAEQKVYVLSHSNIANEVGYSSGSEQQALSYDKEFSLKQFQPSLFRRRMSAIGQYSIGASYLAFSGADIDFSDSEKPPMGAYFGTTVGASQVQQRNLSDLLQHGPSGVKSTLFPDTVLNAPLGNLALAFGLTGCSANFSDLGNEGMHALWHAYNDLSENKISYALVCSAEDQSDKSDLVWQQMQVDEQRLGSGANAMIVVNQQDARANRALAQIHQFSGGQWYFKDDVQQWLCSALEQYTAVPDVIVLSMVNTHHYEAFSSVLKQHFPSAHIINSRDYKASGVACQSLDAVSVATSLIRGRTFMGREVGLQGLDAPESVLVMSVNTQLGASTCIVSKIKGDTHVSGH
ncbi:beta-ketoacyl-[acyl-carrier-protein] synthase family protein [Pseudoalteromonas luteoviolacea]|uniref:3-oxoacyl-(Acyl-carrier-protein) synthase n=1 Tax=Pseudoalteromonas luteoviolacea (strain 2ta16) TaxID=1353533 RepID=V4HQV3_PSEL2|nr:beta-ketoacyl-[acyl-carrier-protein] synthase family protein [Pseudoalteromonas luteoviolacea]ESP92178.1 3-oxoacyl-(acyl-carrier-protein) synthase [Pseudoalteromonas luteoviolacea 2ta16]KZN29284.1 hypothetical protein N483_07570 [Pseudoalteromonas luteoviolacea NCIMB 1944]